METLPVVIGGRKIAFKKFPKKRVVTPADGEIGVCVVRFVEWVIAAHRPLVFQATKLIFKGKARSSWADPSRDAWNYVARATDGAKHTARTPTVLDVLLYSVVLGISVESCVRAIEQGGRIETHTKGALKYLFTPSDVTDLGETLGDITKLDVSVVLRAMRSLQYVQVGNVYKPITLEHLRYQLGPYLYSDKKTLSRGVKELESGRGHHVRYYTFYLLCRIYRIPVAVALEAVVYASQVRTERLCVTPACVPGSLEDWFFQVVKVFAENGIA